MKKNLDKYVVALYVTVVVLTLFVCFLADKTDNTNFLGALPLCLVALVALLVASYFANHSANPTLADEVAKSDDSYAVINGERFDIKVQDQDQDNVIIKLERQ